MNQARKAIYRDFVPKFLGLDLHDRDFYQKQNTSTFKKLFNAQDNVICFILDGTYQRIEKSQNHEFQFDTYSMQKNQNLLKPMAVICPNGRIAECYTNFKATQNDANVRIIK